MTQLSFYEIEYQNETNYYVTITNKDGSTVSMLKSTYDEQQANKDNPVGGN